MGLKVRSPGGMSHKVTLNKDTPLGVQGFDMARPEKWLGFVVWGLKPWFWAGVPARGSSRRGVGGS